MSNLLRQASERGGSQKQKTAAIKQRQPPTSKQEQEGQKKKLRNLSPHAVVVPVLLYRCLYTDELRVKKMARVFISFENNRYPYSGAGGERLGMGRKYCVEVRG